MVYTAFCYWNLVRILMAAGVYTLIIFVYLYHSCLSRIFPDIYSLTGFDFYVSLSIGYLNVCLFHIQIYYIYRELLILFPIISLLTAFHLHPFFCRAMLLYSRRTWYRGWLHFIHRHGFFGLSFKLYNTIWYPESSQYESADITDYGSCLSDNNYTWLFHFFILIGNLRHSFNFISLFIITSWQQAWFFLYSWFLLFFDGTRRFWWVRGFYRPATIHLPFFVSSTHTWYIPV